MPASMRFAGAAERRSMQGFFIASFAIGTRAGAWVDLNETWVDLSGYGDGALYVQASTMVAVLARGRSSWSGAQRNVAPHRSARSF